MISSIEGILLHRSDSSVTVELGGLGLDVYVPARMIETIGDPGDKVRLLTWLCVREDSLTLFGFSSERDRQMFLSLMSVSGIGPRVAMGMISACDSNEIARYIRLEEAPRLTSLPGIGKKTAERIVLELKDKIDPALYAAVEAAGTPEQEGDQFEEALEALLSIGVARSAAEKALEAIRLSSSGEGPSVEDLVREALRKVSIRNK